MVDKRGTDLCGEDNEGGDDEHHHVHLTGPDVWIDVTIAHSRKGDNDEPEGVEDFKLACTPSLQVLNTTYAGNTTWKHYIQNYNGKVPTFLFLHIKSCFALQINTSSD